MVQATIQGRKTQTRRIEKRPLKELAPEPICNAPHPIGTIWWVRETFGFQKVPPHKVVYKAGDRAGNVYPVERWKPSIFMPKKYTRLWLEVTGVWLEPLQQITEAHARAEGCEGPYPRFEFFKLWDSLHGEGAWDQNPLVWVYSYKVIQGP